MAARKSSANVLAFVCLVLFFDAMGVALILPVLPDLIRELGGLSNDAAAKIAGYLLFTFAAAQFVCAPILGGLSDRFGRRPVLLLALLGFSLDYFVMAAAPTLAWLFIARLVSGVCGATFPAANACIVDITSPEHRARNFGLTGASFGLGFILGPAIGGVLGEYATRLPFVVAGVLTLAACIYGFFVLPETHPPDKRRKFQLTRANPLGSLVSVGRHPVVLAILASVFFLQLANQSYVSIWSFYTIEVARWSPLGIGLSAALWGFMLVLVQGVLTGPVVKRFGEVRPALFSLTIAVAAYVGLATAGGPQAIYVWIIVGGFSGFAFPAMQALMTKATAEDSQGELQGAIASSYSVSAIIGPLAMSQIFAAFTDARGVHFPGAGFACAALLISLAIIAFSVGARRANAARAATA